MHSRISPPQITPMGSGAVMRAAAAKVAGMKISNAGLRNLHSENQLISSAACKATTTHPVSSILSSDDDPKSTVLAVGLTGDKIDDTVQKPCWELDDWEFTSRGEQEALPRVVFGGGPPSLKEAKEATDELKDALEKVYLSTPNSIGSGGPYTAGQDPCLDTEVRVSHEAPSVPKVAIRAFRCLSESSKAQTVVASIASDPKVWDAVLKNPTLVDYLQTQKNNMDPSVKVNNVNESVSNADFLKQPSDFKEWDSGSGLFMDFLQSIRINVVDMMGSLYDHLQNFFGGSVAEENSLSTNHDGSASSGFADAALGASFMGLAIMAIMVVVLKRA